MLYITQLCSIDNQEICHLVDFFIRLDSYGVLEKIQLAAQMATLGNFCNLHKSKMNADYHRGLGHIEHCRMQLGSRPAVCRTEDESSIKRKKNFHLDHFSF